MTAVRTLAGAWNRRSRRERVLLAVAALLAAACLAASGVQHLARWRAAAWDRLAVATAEHGAVAAELRRIRAGDRSAGEPPAAVEQAGRAAAERLGLPVSLQAGEDGVVFSAEAVQAGALFGWLQALETEGVEAGRLSVQRTEGGSVAVEGSLTGRPGCCRQADRTTGY